MSYWDLTLRSCKRIFDEKHRRSGVSWAECLRYSSMYTQTPSGALAVERRILMHDVVYNADAASPAASIFSNIHIPRLLC